MFNPIRRIFSHKVYETQVSSVYETQVSSEGAFQFSSGVKNFKEHATMTQRQLESAQEERSKILLNCGKILAEALDKRLESATHENLPTSVLWYALSSEANSDYFKTRKAFGNEKATELVLETVSMRLFGLKSSCIKVEEEDNGPDYPTRMFFDLESCRDRIKQGDERWFEK